MRSVRFHEALTEFVEDAAAQLAGEVAAGAEVPFEVEPRSRAHAGAALYCYRALTSEFISQREPMLERLPSHAEAVHVLGDFAGLERYLASCGVQEGRASAPLRARRALCALLSDVFAEQTEFELRPDRLSAALARLESSTLASAGEYTLVATLHGVAIASPELELAKGLAIAHAETLEGLPEGLAAQLEGTPPPLLVVLTGEEAEPGSAPERAAEVLRELLRALRLFGDGRVALGALAYARVGSGAWSPLAIGGGGRPRGLLLITPDQEDELRAFCNLISRRAPHRNPLAWALQRFEMGCAREHPYEALSDYMLALRALLEPEGGASSTLAGRLSALCATPGQRTHMAERTLEAIELERAAIAGTALEHDGGHALVGEIAGHLRALLRDVICGHLAPELALLADEILLAPEPPSGEEMLGDAGEPEEILDLLI